MVGRGAMTGSQRRGFVALSMLLAVALLRAASTGAAAAEVRVLGNVLSPAYLALNLTVVCARADPTFLTKTKRLSGEVPSVVQHIKDEVTASLKPAEAEAIVRHAADAARTVALGLVRSMSGGSDAEEGERIARWCETTAKPFVLGTVAEHETRHDQFERMLEEAKQ